MVKPFASFFKRKLYPQGISLFPFWVAFLCLLASVGMTKDLGVHGHTFVIQEEDLLEVFERRLKHLQQEGMFEAFQEDSRRRAENYLKSPPAVKGILRTQDPRVHYYDPTVTVPYDLKDHHGKVFHPQGTTFNPLTVKKLTQTLVFMAANDPDQVAWLKARFKNNSSRFKIILVAGSPCALEEEVGVPCYFDQGGSLTQKLQITHVPALVTQDNLRLKIETCLPDLPQPALGEQ